VSKLIKVASTNVKIDVVLNQACSEEISNFCGDIGSGQSKSEHQSPSIRVFWHIYIMFLL